MNPAAPEGPNGTSAAESLTPNQEGVVPEAVERTEGVSMGVDIVEIDRIRAILKRSPAFAKRVFTDEERAYCEKTAVPASHFATRFAAKEAVVKVLGCGFTRGIRPSHVEVVLNAAGKPHVKLHADAALVAREEGFVEIPISLSYTHNEAVAVAMGIRRAPEEPDARAQQAQELTRVFKETRLLLDEI